jgi:DNA-binding winged helix-turn-helix (wHTH) protein/TolB-like protein/Tfp pilus assembly protein PilF
MWCNKGEGPSGSSNKAYLADHRLVPRQDLVDTSVAITRFGPFEVRPDSRELYKFGIRIKIRPQPFQVLSLLIENAGQVVTREQFQQRLWPSDTFVDFEHSLNTAIKELRGILTDSATEPRYIETIPRLGYRFISPVERSEPASLPQSAPEPTRLEAPSPEVQPVVARKPSSRMLMAIFAAAALLLVVTGVALMERGVLHRPGSTASGEVKARPSIAILGFRNMLHRPEDDWMSLGMAEMLRAQLASGQQFRVIPAENIARMNFDLSIPSTDTYGRETLEQIRNHLGTDMVVSGSYLSLKAGGKAKLRIVMQAQDTRTGETIASFTEDGTKADLLQLVSTGGNNLRRALGIGALSETAAREVRASAPANAEADRLYAEGLAKLQSFDLQSARNLFEQSIAADPNFAPSHSALAEGLSELGYDLNAQAEAKKALDLSTNLSREDRFSIEGRYRELIHDPAAATEIYRTLHNFFPDNLDYGLRFGRAQVAANHAADALLTVEALRRLPGPEGKDPRIDLLEASAAERMGNMKRSQQAAAASAARAQSLGSRLMLGYALDSEGWAWTNLGEPDKAIADDSRAREILLAAGDTRTAAKALHGIAFNQRNKGAFTEARQSFEEALNEFRRLGSMWDIASCSHNLGQLLLEQGQLDLAREHLQEALTIQRSQNDKRGVSFNLDGLSNVALSAGHLADAKQMREEALQGFREIGDRRGESIVLRGLAEVLYLQGDLAASTKVYQQAMDLQKDISYTTGLAYSLKGMAEILAEQDRLNEAATATEQSRSIREQNREEARSAENDVQLAEIALNQLRLDVAETLSRRAAAVLEKRQAFGYAALAYSALARTLVAAEKLDQASTAAEHAVALAQKTSDRVAGLQAGFAQAEVSIHNGKSVDAERSLAFLHNQAHVAGYAALELRAQFLLASAELNSGKRDIALAHLGKIQTEARSRGFLLIARQAAKSIATVQGNKSVSSKQSIPTRQRS